MLKNKKEISENNEWWNAAPPSVSEVVQAPIQFAAQENAVTWKKGQLKRFIICLAVMFGLAGFALVQIHTIKYVEVEMVIVNVSTYRSKSGVSRGSTFKYHHHIRYEYEYYGKTYTVRHKIPVDSYDGTPQKGDTETLMINPKNPGRSEDDYLVGLIIAVMMLLPVSLLFTPLYKKQNHFISTQSK